MFKKLVHFALLFIAVGIAMAQKKYSHTIQSKKEFLELQGEPLNDKFANLKSVKVVWDCSAKELYFFNSKQYKYHHDFCEDVLGYNRGLGEFNNESYNPTDQRKFLLANLNLLEKSENWVLELAASDEMNEKMIGKLFSEIKKNVFFGNTLKFYLNTPRLILLQQKGKLSIPCVYSDFIFENIMEQVVEPGKAIGVFKKYDILKKEVFNPNSNEIILLNSTPEVIPDVKGIVITEFQTPLSHLVLLAKNRNIPVYVLTNAWTNEMINSLVGKKVQLTVTKNSFQIKETKLPIAPKPIKEKIILKKDLSVTTIVNINEKVPKNGQHYLGAKALNLSLLHGISIATKKFKTPEFAYGIPFYFYEKHISENNISGKIEEFLNTPKDSINLIRAKLKEIRSSIKNSKLNHQLLRDVELVLQNQNQYASFKFRSSTNAEDVEGFNGAGLYDSKSAKIGDSVKTVERAILEVWASFWNEGAFREREIFGIDHRSCAMGVLFHRSFPDELANGVMISENLYRPEYSGITVNVQKGEESVVQPKDGQTCDEFYVHNFNYLDRKLSIDFRSTSSLNDKKPILTDGEIKQLFWLGREIQSRMNQLWKANKISKKSHPIDIEFKIVGKDRQLYIKQVRPFMD